MKILVELPTWLGDCIMATPAIDNLLVVYRDCDLVFVGSSLSISLMKDHPLCKNTFEMPKAMKDLFCLSREIGKVDLFVSFRYSIRSFFLGVLVTKRIHLYKKKKFKSRHQVEKYNDFICNLTKNSRPPGHLKIYKSKNYIHHNKPLIGINPGASYGSAKCWPPKKYSSLLGSISNDFDIVIFGGKNEISLASLIEKDLNRKGIKNFTNLAGKTSINELYSWISNLHIFITGDSGPMHIASELAIPTVAIFGPTREHETSQWMNQKSLIIKKELECQPCMKRICPLGHHNCMSLISAKEVEEAVRKLS